MVTRRFLSSLDWSLSAIYLVLKLLDSVGLIQSSTTQNQLQPQIRITFYNRRFSQIWDKYGLLRRKTKNSRFHSIVAVVLVSHTAIHSLYYCNWTVKLSLLSTKQSPPESDGPQSSTETWDAGKGWLGVRSWEWSDSYLKPLLQGYEGTREFLLASVSSMELVGLIATKKSSVCR